MTGAPVTDVLGEPFLAETIHLPPDNEGEVVATLVSRRAARPTDRPTDRPSDRPSDRPTDWPTDWAVLHVHGFADYFFQTGYAEWWAARGYDFHALDLRKYGRSIRPHHTPSYVTDLREHFAEIDEAWHRICDRDGHRRVVLSGHSTGGLIVSLWAHHRRPPQLAGVVLNSPWFDLPGGRLVRTVGTSVVSHLGARQPMREIRREVTGFYARSLHRDHGGEWEFDLEWKPVESFTVYAGWLRAVRSAHAELQRGLDVPAPVLVLSSDRSSMPVEPGEDVHITDIVLDVADIRRWATAVGRHLTYVAVPGARHDVVLSRWEAREAAYDALDRWRLAFVDEAAARAR